MYTIEGKVKMGKEGNTCTDGVVGHVFHSTGNSESLFASGQHLSHGFDALKTHNKFV